MVMFLKRYKLALASGFLLATPFLLLFAIDYYKPKFSTNFDDWHSFAEYFGATTGAIGSLIVGFIIYQTFAVQNKQRIEATLFSYLDSFSSEKKLEQEKFIENEVLLFEKIKQLPVETMRDPYFGHLKEFFLETYSSLTATPRLNASLNKYFKFVNSLCFLVHNSQLSEKHFSELQIFLLSQFHDAEIKMVCFYFYLFYDVVNSTDPAFNCKTNFVKQSKLFDGNLFFSDDFPRNFDPRKGEYDAQLDGFKKQVSALRSK